MKYNSCGIARESEKMRYVVVKWKNAEDISVCVNASTGKPRLFDNLAEAHKYGEVSTGVHYAYDVIDLCEYLLEGKGDNNEQR